MEKDVKKPLLNNRHSNDSNSPVQTEKKQSLFLPISLTIISTTVVVGLIFFLVFFFPSGNNENSDQPNAPYPPPFGRPMKSLFSLKPTRIFLNHGSYGNTPIQVQQAERNWRLLMETDTDTWMWSGYKSNLINSRKAIAGIRKLTILSSKILYKRLC